MQKGIKRIKWNRKKFITLSIVALVIISICIGFFLITKNKAVSSASASAKRTVQVTRGNIEVALSGSGTVTSANTSDVMSNVQGKITKAYFKEGDKVKKGDMLFEIDDTDAKLNIQKIENQISQAELSVNSNQKSFSNLTVTAPFDGRISEIAAKAGESVNSNMTLFTITQTSKLTLSAPVSTTDIPDIKVGQKAQVSVQEIMDTIDGVVTAIDDYTYTASNGGMVRNVEVTVSNPGRITDSNTAAVEISTANGTKKSSEVSKFQYADKQVVKSATNGTFSTVNIKENQYVKKGDVLIQIENDDLQISSQTNNLKVQDLENQLAAAQKQLEDYRIYSSIDGTVTGDTAVAGDSIKNGDTLISIRDFDQMQFTISVDELDISKVKVGQDVSITIDALEETTTKPLTGEVIYKAMEGSSSNGVATYDVKIKINETDNLLAGMNANASIILSQAENTLMVPLEAITKMGDRAFVRVIGTGDSQGQPGEQMPKGEPNSSTGSNNSSNNSNNSNTNRANRNANGYGNNSGYGQRNNQNSSGNSSKRQMSAANSANQEYYQGTVMKTVELGVNNDTYVEIKSGLSEGDVVVLPPLVTNSTSSSGNNQNGFSLGGMGGGMMGGGGLPSGGMPPSGNGGQTNRNSGNQNQSGSQNQRN
ncbi:MAG: rane-fusion protein [Eubacterium sp.]|nr:rane-fusion protein [Eubacterium sp.]